MIKNIEFSDRQIEIMELATGIIDRQGIQELTTKNLAAEIGLSEAALYRHFKSKNEIMLSLLDYFMLEMKGRVAAIASTSNDDKSATDLLKEIFTSQLKSFAKKPAIVSVIFSEGIFQFNKELMQKVSGMMEMMRSQIETIVKKGQQDGSIRDFVAPSVLTTIIMGSMRMAVMKWKILGNGTDLVKEGTKVLNGVLKMIEK